MSQRTTIEWATHTWNPVTGCTKVSQGCKHCYAERVASRFTRQGWNPKANAGEIVRDFRVLLHPERLDEPLRWRKPRRVFVCSMSDLFHEAVPDGFIWEVFNAISGARGHRFLVLTKRPKRMAEFVASWLLQDPRRDLLPNLWLGVSAEDQATADERIPLLLQTPAAVRFVSYEPALEPVDFTQVRVGNGDAFCPMSHNEAGDELCHPGLDWIICGGESGPGARPMQIEWAQSAADQCAAAGVAFFMKQDSGYRSGQQGRIPDALWARKEWPDA